MAGPFLRDLGITASHLASFWWGPRPQPSSHVTISAMACVAGPCTSQVRKKFNVRTNTGSG